MQLTLYATWTTYDRVSKLPNLSGIKFSASCMVSSVHQCHFVYDLSQVQTQFHPSVGGSIVTIIEGGEFHIGFYDRVWRSQPRGVPEVDPHTSSGNHISTSTDKSIGITFREVQSFNCCQDLVRPSYIYIKFEYILNSILNQF